MPLPETRPTSSWLLALLCFAAAPMVFVLWFGLVFALSQVSRLSPQFLITSLGLFAFAAWKLVRLGLRLKAPTAQEILQKDPRPPVLYLRSFESDKRTITRQTSKWWNAFSQMEFVTGWSFGTRRLEEVNTKILKYLGPVIAVAPPGENLPQLGAARLSLPDDQWRDGVRNLMRKSQLIIIEHGVSSGLKWEMSEAFRLEPFKPILICAPVRDEEVFLSRQHRYEMLKRALPSEAIRVLPIDIGNTAFFFFKKPDQVTEIAATEGPPEELLDEVRPGAMAEMRKRRFRRRLIIFLATVLGLCLLMVSCGLLFKEAGG